MSKVGANNNVANIAAQGLWRNNPVFRQVLGICSTLAVTNLVLNANEAVGNGGKIHVNTGTRDGWVVLTVSDNGCGISKEFMNECLFRPFRTTKKQGTGIGLFQSKMIVDAHKGQIEVESQEGRGSTFRILLPMKE